MKDFQTMEEAFCFPKKIPYLLSSVADPDLYPDPSDPYVFGHPGSGSFYHHAKIVGKTLITRYCFVTL
jgi:hypothetical protein